MKQHVKQQLRSDFLDRIRVILTVLVILHHVAITYGAEGGWYLRYKAGDLLSGASLTLFCAVNQSFFMGMFFLLAGYFTPRSFDAKGAQRFVIDRLLRLGIPTLIFGFLLGPLTIALAETPEQFSVLSFWWHLIKQGNVNLGPLWFAYALLLFSAVYVAIRLLLPRLSWRLSVSALRHSTLFAALVVWGCGAFLLRLWVPTGRELGHLQIGYFSSYIVLFIIGCGASHCDLFSKIEKRLALPWIAVSVLTIPSLFIYAALAGAFAGVPFDLHGGWTLPVAFYAFWEPFVACGIILGLLWLCRVSAQPWKFWNRLAPLTYPAFIVHAPLVVLFGVWSQPWQQHSLLMFGIVGTASLIASFGVAAVLHKLPGARRVV